MTKITGLSIFAALSMLTVARVTCLSFASEATSGSAIKQWTSPPSFDKAFLFIPAFAMFVSVTMSAPFARSLVATLTAFFEKFRLFA